jgi:hypothetical protein
MARRKHEGIVARHARSCASHADKNCNCSPSFEAWIWSKRDGKKIRRTFTNLGEARNWRADARGAVRKGGLRPATQTTLQDAWGAWLAAVKRGEILSRQRVPYKPSTVRGYEHDVQTYVLADLGALRLGDVSPG